MAGNWRRFCGVTLILLLALFYFKVKFAQRDEDVEASLKRVIFEEETLWPDIAALHGLRLPPVQNHDHQWVTLIGSLEQWQDDLHTCQDVTSCLLQKEKEFESFLKDTEDQKVQLWLLHAAEISNNYSRKLLVMTDKDKPTEEQVNNEYGFDPQNSEIVSVDCLQKTSCMPEADSNTVVKIFGRLSADGRTVSGLSAPSLAEKMLDVSWKGGVAVFSLDGSTSTEFQHGFLQALMIHGFRAVLEVNQGGRQLFKVINDPDPVSRYEIPQDNMGTKYDHQHILIMENDPRVLKAAENLWRKHSAISSVYVLDENHQPKLVFGAPVPLTENSRLVLVGHGARENSGDMTLSGYNAKNVADIIKQANRVSDKIKTISFVACELGSDPAFAETVLTELEAANIKTELHLRRGKVQVRSDGTKITQATNEDEWQHKDDTQKVVVVLDNGKVVFTNKSKSNGEAVSTSSSNHLKRNNKDKPFIKTEADRSPKIFIDQNLMKELGWDACFELQAMTWAFFIQDRPRPNKVDTSNEGNLKTKYRIMKFTTNKNNVVWLETEQEIKEVLSQCDEIKSGDDVGKVIKHYAETRQKKETYLMVNGWIYVVNRSSFYVFLVGKKLANNEINIKGKIKDIDNYIRGQIGNEAYPKMKTNILSEIKKTHFVQFVKHILGEKLKKPYMSLNTEAWCTTYFTASMISESVRNYRTFMLLQMALDMTDRIDNIDRKTGFEFFFETHSMASGGTWVDNKTGNEGVTSCKAKDVVGREVNLYKSWIGNEDPKNNVDKMFGISQTNNVITESDKQSFVKSYNFYKKLNSTEASGPLGRYDNSHTRTQDLMLGNSLRVKNHFLRLKASVVDQVHSQLKIQNRDNLVQMHLQEGSSRIEDGEFICQLVSEGVGPLDFRVKLSPDTKFYKEKMSAVNDLQSDSYIGNILSSVVKSSAFVLLVIFTIQTTERVSETRDRRRSEGAANRTARVRPKKGPKQQKWTKTIHVVVNTQEGSMVRVQIELFTPLHHFMNTYCEEQNGTVGSFRFYYQEQSINFTDTPLQLGMKDGATIEVYKHSTSG